MAKDINKKKADELLKRAYEENYVSVYRYCLSKLKNNEMAEDSAQEAFLVLYKKLLAGDEVIYIKSFLMKTASNFVLKKYEEIKRSHKAVQFDEIINIPSKYTDMDENLTFEEYSREISSALSTLDARIFTLKYIDEYKINEIADELNMSVAAVTTRLSRMRQKLRQMFK